MNTLNNKDDVIRIILEYLGKYPEIHSIFISGSTLDKTYTDFSDLDLWIITQTESDIKHYKKTIIKRLWKLFQITGYYRSTDTHFFIILQNWIQIDLNLITTAQYFSIKKSTEKNFIFDNKNSFMWKKLSSKILSDKFLEWYTTLERAVSKFEKDDLFWTLRFIDSIRANNIIPIMNACFENFNRNNIEMNLSILPVEIQQLFLMTYALPQEKSIEVSLSSIMQLFMTLEKSLQDFTCIYNLEKQKQKLSQYFLTSL